ncbi:MAG: long-chain acyl-CoA synthetase [Mycobacterium sp.]|nr:long-chain acyl-CoA synthetase [Mycobacterium sp.]
MSRTLCSEFQATAAKRPDSVALCTHDNSVTVTWRQYADRVRAIAGGLASLGIVRGDTVGIMLTNRPEFHLVDTGALHLGATPFSVYNTLSAEQVAYLFANAANRVVVCERAFLPVIRDAMSGSTESVIEHIVLVDGEEDGVITLADLESRVEPDFDFEASWKAVQPDDILTIIYTSGTTGPPKGVELTHANLIAEFDALRQIMPAGLDDIIVSYLPDAHIANRWGAHYSNLINGITIATLADIRKTITALPAVRPTFFGGVPQTWYRLKSAIDTAMAAEPSPVKKRLGRWALDTGTKVAWLHSEGKAISPVVKAQHALAERLVLSKIRARIGLDRVRVSASGAAPIAPDVLAFILGLGLPVCEVWGMSETSAVATTNRPGAYKIGTVGQAVPGTDVKLAEDGELLVRGPIVMRGYRNDPEKTAATFDADGWLQTGDIATIDADGFVTIVDRKKELIINASGKNMSPSNIEGAIRSCSPMIGSAVAIGDNRPYVVALLTVDADAGAAYAASHGLTDTSPSALAADPGVRASLDAAITEANSKLSRVEQIKKFAILPTVWEPGGDELTPTLKLKRKPIGEKYASEIEDLYT